MDRLYFIKYTDSWIFEKNDENPSHSTAHSRFLSDANSDAANRSGLSCRLPSKTRLRSQDPRLSDRQEEINPCAFRAFVPSGLLSL